MTPIINGLVLAIGVSPAGSVVVRVTVTVALGLLATRLARDKRSAVRHALLAAMFGVMLLLPIATVLMPPFRVGVPVAMESPTPGLPFAIGVYPKLSAITLGAGSRAAGIAPPVLKLSISRSLSNLLLAGWATGVAFFLLPAIVGLVANPFLAPIWFAVATWAIGRRASRA